jgi:hypothetical protein|tara:strand:+ start:564 stop:2033 length:1470 start_codon:yes stop_codon:yes gene_type:complete
MNKDDQQAFDIVKLLFKNDRGEPFEMTPGQVELFRAIYEKKHPRVSIACYTQYGKSDVISMAILLRCSTFPEKWPILGGTKDKARIIMSKLIKHIFENDYTLGKFEIGKDESVERIKRDRSKDRITFRVNKAGDIGEAIVLSADARRKGEDAGDILIGHGAPNLVQDDAALIPDPIHGKALRMLGGHKDNFLVKVSNTFNRNHFYRSHHNPKYLKLVVDYKKGIEEGRITQEYIEEMRGELDPIMFGILYECVFPPADMVDEAGWMPLLLESDIEEAQRRSVEAEGEKKLGVDIAESGNNYNAYVLRQDNYAWVKEKNLESNLMKTANRIKDIGKDEVVRDHDMYLDAVGVGAGVVSRLHEMNLHVNGIKAGEKASDRPEAQKLKDPIEFFNMRAEMYWKAARWIKKGGALEPHTDWKQLCKIRYKEDQSKRIKIMPKEEMRLQGLITASESPDVADAFVLTFAKKAQVVMYHTQPTEGLPAYYPKLGI